MEEPGLTCANCHKLYAESNGDIRPACFTNNCPIEDLASDIEVTDFIEQFQIAKSLFSVSEDPGTQRKIFEELGLYEEPAFHLKLEWAWARWKQKKTKKQDEWKKVF